MASYCTPTDLAQYLPAQVLSLASPTQQQKACDDATDEANSYLRGRYALPLSHWGSDVTKYTAWIACYMLMQLVGFAPQAGADRLIVERYYQAVGWPDRIGTGWFPGVQRQAIHPDVTPAIPPTQDGTRQLPKVSTQPMRGWQQVRNGKPVIG